jgi:membrane protease YdiL (CAAX protease family)
VRPDLPSPPSFWRTVRLLLGASRGRAAGRRKRQQELLNQRAGKNSTNWGGLGFTLTVLLMAVLNIGAAFAVRMAVASGARIEVERKGKIVVSSLFFNAVLNAEIASVLPGTADQTIAPSIYSSEAKAIADRDAGAQTAIEQKLRDAVRNHGTQDFISKDDPSLELTALSTEGRLPALLGSVFLLWWGMMLVFQGEGLELDLQRRRHPMWEWLFTHPVPPGAIFMAEMLSPLAANPIFWSGPLFAGFMYGFVYGPGLGVLAALLVGVPVTVAAACLGKALEIGVILRFSPRSRGAMIGLMGWMGYASMMVFFLGLFVIPKIIAAVGKFLGLFTLLPWPWLSLFLGGQSDSSFSFLAGMLTCWIVASVTLVGAIRFSVWGTQQGLSGNFAADDSRPSVPRTGEPRFGKDPLYRKEFLWFIRDRSAIVQTILIPLTVAGLQAFNLRGLLSHAQGAWNYLCGVGILFGTYFLWILGPRSLSSEGTALWIALTWPRGLESLLKAKAWLWSMISSGIVALVLCYAAFLYPAHIWKIALVGIGWFFFGRSMAEKTVTLVAVASSSGETEKIPSGRRWAAQLGMLTFCIGVLTQQWHIAIMGIVYSYITAAAMWQNFRARLPYLYDPWSETLPPPPTLMHAMVAISILVEAGAVLTGIIIALAGAESVAVAQAISYGICAVIVSIGVSNFLSDRDVSAREIWRWPAATTDEGGSHPWWRGDGSGNRTFLRLLSLGAAGGLVLGLLALGYLVVLSHLPVTSEIIRKSQEQMAKVPNLKISYAVMAVVFAPFAEEYLFRGLLYRALDREWGGWRAVVGSAAFFAIYHGPLSWLPVGLLGVANALLFKKTGRLAPAVILHMVYNTVVLTYGWKA